MGKNKSVFASKFKKIFSNIKFKTLTMKLFLINFISVFLIASIMCFLINYCTNTIIDMYNQYYTDSLMFQKEKQCKLQVESIMEIIENEFSNVKNGLKAPIDAKRRFEKT